MSISRIRWRPYSVTIVYNRYNDTTAAEPEKLNLLEKIDADLY